MVVASAVVGHDLIANCVAPPGATIGMTGGWCAEAWINRYQALITGTVASLAAIATIFTIRAQIKQVSDAEEDRSQRQEIASRAKLLMALDVLSDYVDTCIRELARLHSVDSFGKPVVNVPDNFSLPEIPMYAVENIEGGIAYARKDRINRIRGLLTWLQIQYARVRDNSGVKRSIHSRDQAIFDAFQLRVLINKLFNYARKSPGGLY
jgi:hypothetical protein